MFKVSVMYPNSEGCTFDREYYVGTHMPMVRDKLGKLLTEDAVDAGVGGLEPGSKAPFVAIGHLYFTTEEDLQAAVPLLVEATADIPNFTNVQPVVQVSQVLG